MKKRKKEYMASINDYLDEFNKEPGQAVTETNQAIVSEEDSVKLVLELSKSKKMNAKQAFTAICIICQKGGTSKRASGTIYATIDGINVTLEDVRKCLDRGVSLRQWARTNASAIQVVADKFSIAGDLAKIIMRKYSDVSSSDSIWLSNFQMDNMSCPENLRGYIREHFQNLFPKKSS